MVRPVQNRLTMLAADSTSSSATGCTDASATNSSCPRSVQCRADSVADLTNLSNASRLLLRLASYATNSQPCPPSTTHVSVTHLSTTHLSITHLSITCLSITHLSTTNLSISHLSITRLSITHLSVTHPSTTHLSVTRLSMTHLPIAHLSTTHL